MPGSTTLPDSHPGTIKVLMKITRCDWLITSHVTQTTRSDWSVHHVLLFWYNQGTPGKGSVAEWRKVPRALEASSWIAELMKGLEIMLMID